MVEVVLVQWLRLTRSPSTVLETPSVERRQAYGAHDFYGRHRLDGHCH